MKKMACMIGVVVLGLVLVGGFSPTQTKAQGPTPNPKAGPGRESLPGLLVTPVPQEENMIFPAEGRITVIIQLESAPLGEATLDAAGEELSSADFLARINAERAQLRQQQNSLIGVLTAPPYNGRVIGTTLLASNTIILEVDASLIQQIQALPGVAAVRPERIGTLDDSSPSVGPSFGPHLD